MKAPRLIHQLAGEPPVEGAVAKLFTDTLAICCMCGREAAYTASADKALGANFTDRTMFSSPDSAHVCWACTAICSGKPPRTFRQWTVVAAPGVKLAPSQEKAATWIGQHDGLCLTSKANTSPIIDTLLDPPDSVWVVSIAESGQKHVLPYADINHGDSGVVRMETIDVAYDKPVFRHVFDHALALRRLGQSAEAITEGAPKFIKTRADLKTWHTHTDALNPYRRAPILKLALWTITKGIIENAHYTNS